MKLDLYDDQTHLSVRSALGIDLGREASVSGEFLGLSRDGLAVVQIAAFGRAYVPVHTLVRRN